MISPAPVSTGPGNAPHINSVRPGATLNVTFICRHAATARERDGLEPVPAGSNTVLNDAAGTDSWQVPFSADDAGEYEVERIARVIGSTDTLPPAPRVAFRINAAPTAAITITESAGTVPRIVTFTSIGSTDPDGSGVVEPASGTSVTARSPATVLPCTPSQQRAPSPWC